MDPFGLVLLDPGLSPHSSATLLNESEILGSRLPDRVLHRDPVAPVRSSFAPYPRRAGVPHAIPALSGSALGLA
jgi:hypothetical protein